MTVKKALSGDTLTVTVDGWLDTMTSPDFHTELQDLEGAKNVILDLGGVEYISSAGLREIVALYHRVSEQDGAFSVRRVKKEVMDVFTLTRFNEKFEIKAD